MEYMEWVERLGGWGVVLLIVKWMMSRLDRTISALEKSVDAYGAFQKTNDEAHTAIVNTLKEIRDAVRVG